MTGRPVPRSPDGTAGVLSCRIRTARLASAGPALSLPDPVVDLPGLHRSVVALQGGTEDVGPVVAGHEIEILAGHQIDCGPQRSGPGAGDGTRRQSLHRVGVVRVRGDQILSRDVLHEPPAD